MGHPKILADSGTSSLLPGSAYSLSSGIRGMVAAFLLGSGSVPAPSSGTITELAAGEFQYLDGPFAWGVGESSLSASLLYPDYAYLDGPFVPYWQG